MELVGNDMDINSHTGIMLQVNTAGGTGVSFNPAVDNRRPAY